MYNIDCLFTLLILFILLYINELYVYKLYLLLTNKSYHIIYSAFSSMFVGGMPLFNHGSYILIKFVRLVTENAVLRDKMSFFI